MVKIAWLCEYPLAGGGDRSLLATLEGIREEGFEPIACCPANGELFELMSLHRVPVRPLDWHDASGRRLSQFDARGLLARLLERECPALLHANSLSMARLAGPVAADLRIPCIGHLRDIVGLSAQAMADVNRCTRLLAVSAATRDYHRSQGLSPGNSFVLYNGVDLRQFAPSALSNRGYPSGALRQELGLPGDALLVGCIGQIILRKGHDLLLPLARCLRDQFPAAHLVVIGNCPSRKDEAIAFDRSVRAQLNGAAPGQVHFLERRDDVAQILPQLNLLVHPARQEPLGRVLLEAAAAGVAIVATDVGGTSEIFPPESQAAIVVPAGDAAALAQQTVELLRNPALGQQLGANARRRAETAFDAVQAASGLARHYAEVLRMPRVADSATNR